MHYIYFILASIFFSSCASQRATNKELAEQRINLNDYIQRQIKVGKTGSKKTIKIPKGTYHFYEKDAVVKELYISNHDQKNPKHVGIYLDGLQDLTIDGNGSAFIFHGQMLPVVLKNSKNVVLKNFTIDFELPHIRQLEILEVDKVSNTSIAQIHPSGNYQILNDTITFTDAERVLKPTWSMPFRADRRLAYNRADVGFNPEKVEEIAADRIRISGWKQNELTAVGERFALRTYSRPTPGIFLDYNTNTTIQNITVHYAEGMALLAQLCDNIHLDGFNVALKANDIRYFTAQADATHFSACKGIILSENGLYEGMADDAINVHGTYLRFEKQLDAKTIQARYMHGQAYGFLWGELGDTVQFIDSDKMQLVNNQKYRITAIKPVDAAIGQGVKVFDITFDRALPEALAGAGKFGVENLTWTPKVIFRKNIVRNNRARGSLFSTPKAVICEDNLFDHTHGTAILLCGDCNGWYETGACKDVLIRNNTFINALTAQYQFTNAIISIYPEIPNLESQDKFFHSNVRIEGNIFETFDQPIVYAKSIQGLSFKNNVVKKNEEFKPFHWNKSPFLLEKVDDVVIEGNTFPESFDTSKAVQTKFSKADAVHIGLNK